MRAHKKRIHVDPKIVEKYASQGLTQQQICANLDISYQTFQNRRKEPDGKKIDEAMERGYAKGVAFVTNKLMQLVKQGHPAAIFFYLKCKAGWREKEEIEISGDRGVLIIHKTIKDDDGN